MSTIPYAEFEAQHRAQGFDEVLVRNEQLAVSVSAGTFDFQRVGALTVSAVLKPGVELATLEKRLDEVLADVGIADMDDLGGEQLSSVLEGILG